MTWRNRILGYDTKPVSQFTANPLNFRRHPNIQREALRDLLGEVGWVGAVIENSVTGNLIDGHARIEEALSRDDETPIPYLKVELSEEEEKLVLASFDPLSAMAQHDSEALALLLNGIQQRGNAVDVLLDELRLDSEMGVSDGKEPQRQLSRKSAVMAAFPCSDVAVVEKALRLTGEQNRGVALVEICRSYLNAEGQLDVSGEDAVTALLSSLNQ